MKLKGNWKKVGHFGVDAGICWIGDPCYVFFQEKMPETLGNNWHEFCKKINTKGPTLKSFNYALGHEGLGICISTGMGDGTYPVYALITDEGTWGHRVSAVFIDFMDIMNEDGVEVE